MRLNADSKIIAEKQPFIISLLLGYQIDFEDDQLDDILRVPLGFCDGLSLTIYPWNLLEVCNINTLITWFKYGAQRLVYAPFARRRCFISKMIYNFETPKFLILSNDCEVVLFGEFPNLNIWCIYQTFFFHSSGSSKIFVQV